MFFYNEQQIRRESERLVLDLNNFLTSTFAMEEICQEMVAFLDHFNYNIKM